MATAVFAFDTDYFISFKGIRELHFSSSLVTDSYDLTDHRFYELIGCYLEEDGFIHLNDRATNEIYLEFSTFTVKDFERDYFRLYLELRNPSGRLWSMATFGMVPPDEMTERVERKLEIMLNYFYYEYLDVNNIIKESRKKVKNYSQWYRTKIWNKKGSYRDFYFKDDLDTKKALPFPDEQHGRIE